MAVHTKLFTRIHQVFNKFVRPGPLVRCASTGLHNMDQSARQPTAHMTDVDGGKIHYVRAGTGNQVLLLMPGALGSSKTDFKYQIENLNKDMFTLIAWDPRGYGRSLPPDRTWPQDFLRRDAEDAARLMEVIQKQDTSLTDRKFSMLGWSDGGTTALLLAMMYPERIDKLVIWGAATYVTDSDIQANNSIRDIDAWSPRMRETFLEIYDEEYFRKLCNNWADAYNSYADFNNGEICSKELSKVQCPSLIFQGAKDSVVGQFHADHIHANVKDSRLINVPDGKHNLHMKYYKMFNSTVEQFLVNPDHVNSKL